MNYMSPFFSIVMANYNSGHYIERAIQSVLSQSCKDFELIVVDGGSSDESVDIIKKYTDKLSWWVSEPDKGQSDAFNKGFSHATGRYYTWLNADDLLLPNVLEKVKAFIEKKKYQPWIAINTCYIDKDDRVIQCSVCPDFSNKVLKHGTVSDIGPSSFFSAELFSKYGPFDIDNLYTMDCDLWMKFVNGGHRYYRVPGWGWAFRVHELSKTSGGITGKPSEKHIASRRKIRNQNNFTERWINRYYQKAMKLIKCSYQRFRMNKKYVGLNIKELNNMRDFE